MTSKRIREFEIAECEEVRSSISLVQRCERHENQMKGCAAELKVSGWLMIAWTLWSCDTVKGRRGMADDGYVML